MSANLTDRARRIYEIAGMDVEPSMLCRIIRAAMIESRDTSGKVNLISLYDLTNELDKGQNVISYTNNMKLWAQMASAFYNKDAETAEKMGVENFFASAAANMLDSIAENVTDEDTKKYLIDQANLARKQQQTR